MARHGQQDCGSDPDPETIAQRAAAIRSAWSADEETKRRVGAVPRVEARCFVTRRSGGPAGSIVAEPAELPADG